MNEQINNLRLDAGISTLQDAPYLVAINKSGEIIDPIIGLEKFAELIVKECIRVPYDMWDKAELNADIAVKIEHRIKEHFGVEE